MPGEERKELVLVRHGETVGNSSVRLYGVTDIELSDAGRAQMRCVAETLAGTGFRRGFSSPLKRSAEGARIVLGGRPPEPEVVAGFQEIDFGEWEGVTLAEAESRDPEAFAAWKSSDMKFRFPGGESREEFRDRVSKAAIETLRDVELPSLAVLHKGIIKVILAALLKLSFEELMHSPVELGCIHRLEREGGEWRVTSWNETGHLGGHRMPGT